MSRRIPTLETRRLIIRELTMDDLESINDVLNKAFASQTSVDERQRWLQWTLQGYEMFAMLQQPHYGERAVVSRETGEMVGAVGIVPYLDTSIESRRSSIPQIPEPLLKWVCFGRLHRLTKGEGLPQRPPALWWIISSPMRDSGA